MALADLIMLRSVVRFHLAPPVRMAGYTALSARVGDGRGNPGRAFAAIAPRSTAPNPCFEGPSLRADPPHTGS